jgi:hypothetical protein
VKLFTQSAHGLVTWLGAPVLFLTTSLTAAEEICGAYWSPVPVPSDGPETGRKNGAL